MNKSIDPVSHLELTFGNYPYTVIGVDELGRVQYANPGAKQLFKGGHRNLIGSNWAGLDVQLTLAKWKTYWRDTKNRGTLAYQTELLATGSDILWPIEVDIVDFTDYVLLLFLHDRVERNYRIDDATDRARLANSKDHVDELMQLSIDGARDMIFWTRPDGTFFYVNRAVAHNLGYEQSAFAEMQVIDIAPYFDHAFRKKFWQQLRDQGRVEGLFEVVTSAEETLTISANVNYLVEDGLEVACSICRDITQKQKRDASLHLSSIALDSAADSIVWLEDDYVIKYINQSLINHVGGDLQSWAGKPINKIFPQLKIRDVDLEAAVEIDMPSRTGQTIRLDLNFGRIDFEDKTYFTIVGRDITESYQKREELRKAYIKIEDLSNKLKAENIELRKDTGADYDMGNIITVSKKYKQVIQEVGHVADTNTTVLILGETGTGKELLARAVHVLSSRADGPLIKVDCATLPASLIESELFGHEKGAFTGAIQRKIGRFEAADGGSVFLDEVGELPMDLQAKLLRVLQEGAFERVGSTETIKVDVRLIAATNRDLEKMVEAGQFRSDLYYRLNVFPIYNLPLRDRPEDIPVLVKHFAAKFAKKQGKKIKEISAPDMKKLKTYSFPGNVRELENIVERAVVLCRSKVLTIPFENNQKEKRSTRFFQTFDEMQRSYLLQALKKTGGRITGPEGAGRLLGLNDRTLMSKMRKFDIHKKEYLV